MALPAHPMKNKGGRPKGTGNVLRQSDDVREIIVQHLGTSLPRAFRVLKEHVGRKNACHTCLRLMLEYGLGRPPQEIKHTGRSQPPLILMLPSNSQVLRLEEQASIEGEAVELEEEVEVGGE